MDSRDFRNAARLDGERLRQARASQSLSLRAVSRSTDIRPGTLVKLEKGEPVTQLTVWSLNRLAAAVCVDARALLAPGVEAEVAEEPGDDVKVEAVLAQAGKAVNRDDIAWALGWNLDRATAALGALEERLRETGQRVRHAKFGWYGLGVAQNALTVDEIARAARCTLTEYGIHQRHAKILRRLASGDRRAGLRTSRKQELGKADPTAELLAARLVVPVENRVVLSEDVAFSLCLGEVETKPGPTVAPRVRALRAERRPDYAAARGPGESRRWARDP